MNTEQRLIDAFSATRDFAPSDDLWQRVLHSIEEDRAHRRRVFGSVVAAVIATALFGAVLMLSVEALPSGVRIDWRVLEIAETVLLILTGGLLGPLIRRFGRGYVADLMPRNTEMGNQLLGLLDVGFYLMVAGYVTTGTRFEAPLSYVAGSAAGQLEEVALRVGGLLLLLGVLHALLIMALPVQSLVVNTTRAGAKLPKWLVFVLVLAAIPPLGLAADLVVGVFIGGF